MKPLVYLLANQLLRCAALIIVLSLPQALLAQSGRWIAANQGLADVAAGESLEIVQTLTLNDGRVFTFVRNHSGGEARDGAYQYDPVANRWTRVAPRLNQYGYSALVSSGTRIFAVPGGNSQAVYELNVGVGQWEQRLTLPDIGLALSRGVDALGDRLYAPCRIEGDQVIADHPDLRLQKNEEFVIEADVTTGTTTLLRNPEQPLLIGTKGGNPRHPVVLTNGVVYHYSTFEYRDRDGRGGLYAWNGTDWVDASGGLNAINITGSGFGPIGPIFTDTEHRKLFIQTQQGTYQKTTGGWWKHFYRTGQLLTISPDYLFLDNGGGSFLQVDRAVTTPQVNPTLSCIVRIRHFVTADNGQTFVAELVEQRDNQGGCSDSKDDRRSLGMYRYVADDSQPGRVKNLHLTTGTYLGGEGMNEIAQTAFTPGGALLVGGNFPTNANAPTTTPLGAVAEAPGKIYELSADGQRVNRSVVLGNRVDDLAVNAEGDIAVVGDFGVAVLSPDYRLKWSSPEGRAERPRIAIADDGTVVAVVASASNGAGQVKLYDNAGKLRHTNSANDKNGVHINDVAISSAPSHQQYYVAGYTQASSVLQVAYLKAYALTPEVSQRWRTWGFGADQVNTSEYGADTRAYHVAVTDDQVYVSGESAGGGPGGFTVFAYNGQDLTTPVATDHNDFFTDGTNSCGPCHISFLGRINPATGIVQQGKFFHTRLSNGKTNTLRNRWGDLAVDEQGNVLLVGESFFQIQDRDVFNVNGTLVGTYAGDQYVLMVTPDLRTRLLWGVFSRQNGGGTHNRIAVGNGRVAYLAQSDRGEMITTDDALRATPYNGVQEDGTLSASDAYLAVWDRNVWETANQNEVELAFIAADSCFRVDDQPCTAPFDQPPLPDEPTDSGDPNSPTDPDAPSGPEGATALRAANLITPNGDGRNDAWSIAGLERLSQYQIRVFTRNGQPVYDTDRYQQDWRGTYRGQPLPAGVYYYAITVAGRSKAVTGYLTIAY